MKLLRLAAACAALGVLSGCATAISRPVQKEAVPLGSFNFGQVRATPASFDGKTVILGGELLEVRNRAADTVLVVFEKPLDRMLRPRPLEMGGGRFFVRFAEYLDPAVFTRGRAITVAGRVSGVVAEKVGEFVYPYVSLEGREVYLWKDGFEVAPPWYEFGARYPYPAWYEPSGGIRPWQ